MRLPSTLKRAFRVPGSASKPAWTMAELALLVPVQTSSLRSTTQMRPLRRLSSRAMAQPMTPPPMTSTSYMIHLSFLKTKSHAKAPGVSSGQFCMAQHLTA